MLIDSHAHIYTDDFDADFDAMIARARAAGVAHWLMPNIDADTIDRLHRTADRLPENAHPMMGIHPCSVKQADMDYQLETIERHLFSPTRKYCAVGEIGIDLHWDKTTLDIQTAAFETQINWAKTLCLPIAIHVRESFDEVLAVVDRLHDSNLSGVFHCFTGTEAQARHIAEYGTFKMGIGGVLTFKNGRIDQFIHRFDPALFVLETDSPYLAPVPHRGKRNEPAYAALVAEKLAAIYGVAPDEMARITTANCAALFNMSFVP